MIFLKFQGQLGNQMFQYAAGRIFAEKQKTSLVTANRYNQLFDAFGIGNQKAVEFLKSRYVEQILPHLGYKSFRPKQHKIGEGRYAEETVLEIPDRSIVSGWFQSESYFKAHAEDVRSWFVPRQHLVQIAEQSIPQRLRENPDRICVIHMRFGDYYLSDLGYGHPELGWVLPVEYFKEATRNLPPNLSYIIVSDMPDRAERWLEFLDEKIILRGNPAVSDMWVLTQAKYNIISNSTFSWWGSWLNPTAGKEVYAPEFFNGWWVGDWFPTDIHVDDWNYIPRTSIIERVGVWQKT